MNNQPRLGVSDALYLKPLLSGLDGPDSPFGLLSEIPAGIARKFSDRPEDVRGAFLSPIDYGRHGGMYQIIPGIAVSSAVPTRTVQLFIREGVSNIRTMAVDIRVTSEIILAKIILLEKFPNLSGTNGMQFVPMLPDVTAMLAKSDAALIARVAPGVAVQRSGFSLDLVEEWNDLTGLPYVHGLWVVREGHFTSEEAEVLLASKVSGLHERPALAERWAAAYGMSTDECREYLSSFSYDLGENEEQSLSEFFRFAYYHGVLGDVPDVNFMPLELPPSPPVLPN